MSELTLKEITWNYSIGKSGTKRYVIRQKKDGNCINDPVGQMGDYCTYVEELFISSWHIIESTVRIGFSTFDHAFKDVEQRMRDWH